MRYGIVIRLHENKPTIVVAGGEDSNGNKLQFDLNFEIINVLTKIFKKLFCRLTCFCSKWYTTNLKLHYVQFHTLDNSYTLAHYRHDKMHHDS